MDTTPKKDALGRLFTATCLIEMISDKELPMEVKEQLTTARALLIQIKKDIANA